jgi:hypothetical protein
MVWDRAARIQSQDGEFVWLAKTRVTQTPERACLFYAARCADKDGLDGELLILRPSLLQCSRDPFWLKVAVPPFAEEGEIIRANPHDPGAEPYWHIDISLASVVSDAQL